MSKITPCLWYDGAAEAAASFYISLLPDSRIETVVRAPADNPSVRQGDIMLVEFTLAGMKFMALNGGPQFGFTEAVSFQIYTEDQAETDRLWDALIADGGAESQCGWLKDRWGLSWQIVPRPAIALMSSSDPDVARRASQALMTMRKIDIAAMQAAAEDTHA